MKFGLATRTISIRASKNRKGLVNSVVYCAVLAVPHGSQSHKPLESTQNHGSLIFHNEFRARGVTGVYTAWEEDQHSNRPVGLRA